MDIYLGNVDALAQAESRLPVIVIDGRTIISNLAVLSHVIQWQSGAAQLQLIHGNDVPDTDGLYICTDVRGNVRYGQVMATAAGCFRFQEQYANGGYTRWVDYSHMKKDRCQDFRDLSELSNWMLLLPTSSPNTSDPDKFPVYYTPDTSVTPCSIKPSPCDNRTDEQKSLSVTHSKDSEDHREREAKYRFYRWTANLRGRSRYEMTKLLRYFISSRKDLEQYLTDDLSDIPFIVWREFALDIETKRKDSILSRKDISRVDDIFVMARACYFTLLGKKPGSNYYFDSYLEKLDEAETNN